MSVWQRINAKYSWSWIGTVRGECEWTLNGKSTGAELAFWNLYERGDGKRRFKVIGDPDWASSPHVTSIALSPEVRAAVKRYEGLLSKEIKIDVAEMKLSGDRCDYFVRIRVGDREITPHVFRERWKAEYEVAEWEWLLNGKDKPDLMAYGPRPSREKAE